jgi:Ca-activated chloride channel family protein
MSGHFPGDASTRCATQASAWSGRSAAGLFRRHVPPLLFLFALLATIFAIARPNAVVTLPTDQRTTILAIDVSLSMRANDIKPSRLEAAQTAAKAFVKEQPADVLVGIVSFAGTASVVQPPTHNRDDLIAAIDRFELQRHTAIGSGIIVSLATLSRKASTSNRCCSAAPARCTPDGQIDRESAERNKETVQGGAAGIHARPRHPSPTAAAPPDRIRSKPRGWRPTTACGSTRWVSACRAAGRGHGWILVYMAFDEEALKSIAEITHGEYPRPAQPTAQIYQRLNARYVLEKETEVSALSVAARRNPAPCGAIAALVQPTRLKRRGLAYLSPLPPGRGGAARAIGREAERDGESDDPADRHAADDRIDRQRIEPAAPNTNVTGGHRSASATSR